MDVMGPRRETVSEQNVISRGLSAAPGSVAGRDRAEARRACLFRETPFQICERMLLGTAWALKPGRIGTLRPLARMWLASLVAPSRGLPDAGALAETCELAGIAPDLSVPTLLAAYRQGLFPHGHVGAPKWLSPAKRGVLHLDNFRISSRLRSMMRQGRYAVTFDRDFEGVIKACAGRRPGQWHLTWITPRIMHAYAEAHDAGHVHSFEVWNDQGELVGGGYGVAVGRVFVIESQFFRVSNASKIGFSVLAWHLARWGFVLADNKWLTPTTAQMGFHEMRRDDYLRRLAALGDAPPEAPWQGCRWEPELDAKAVADWRPGAHADTP
jgi:leucyl/phenylalanyl-tRNA---protein transferase